MIKVPGTILGDPKLALTSEWLVTNGIGGYASSTVIGANTRRYHGLLVAAFPPPLERQVLLAKVDEELTVGSETYPLGANEYLDGTIHPGGYRFLKSFRLEFGVPTFEYRAAGVTLVKQVWMERGRDTIYILYRVLEAPGEVVLRVRPFCAFRSYHGDVRRGGKVHYHVDQRAGQVMVEARDAPYALKLVATPDGSFVPEEDWYWNFLYRVERDRGFNCLEDLYTPGVFTAEITPGETFALAATCEREAPDLDVEDAFNRELERRRALAGGERDRLRRELLLAADQFVIVGRERGRRRARHEILAGYHWFTDWGRDTMISLPGLLLSTGRIDDARDVLVSYAHYLDQGMLPNRFTDAGEPEYNTADATLWYFQAISRYMTASGDRAVLKLLFSYLEEIVRWHVLGTRFGIKMDSCDGLLFTGEDGSQITWMDACVAGRPVTPRIGKPVEINALWFNALNHMTSWARYLGKRPDFFERLSAKCMASFRSRFWLEAGGCLKDVVDGPDGDDPTLRPNQIIAVSVPNSPLDSRQQKLVVDTIERVLLMPHGLRTLSPDDPAYAGRYKGGPEERDRAYHQGAAWPWLLGQFADAHYRVYRDLRRIRELLDPFKRHLSEAGLGSISELFDGDPPHTPGGCIAQAWSVAEILRVCTDLSILG